MEEKIIIQSLLKKQKFIRFHVDTAKMLGGSNNNAILLQLLIDRDHYHNTNDGWFYVMEQTREKYTNIKPRQQRNIIQYLKKLKIIETQKRGMPAKLYFKINYKKYYRKLIDFIKQQTNESETQIDESETQISEKIQSINQQVLPVRPATLTGRTSEDCPYIYNNTLNNNILSNRHKHIIIDNMLKNFPGENSNENNLDISNREFKRKSTIENKSAIKHSIIESAWNSKNWTTKHRPGTKLYQGIVDYIDQLSRGKFGNGKDTHWLEQNKELASKKWTEHEIESAIDKLTLLLHEDYWPEEKNMPKSLKLLIYNPRSNTLTGKSWLFAVVKNPPQLLNETVPLPKELDSEVTNKFIRLITKDETTNIKKLREKMPEDQLRTIIRRINDIIQYRSWIIENVGRKQKKEWVLDKFCGLIKTASDPTISDEEWYAQDFLDPELRDGTKKMWFYDRYIDYLRYEVFPEKRILPRCLGPDARNWTGFLEYLGEVLWADYDRKEIALKMFSKPK